MRNKILLDMAIYLGIPLLAWNFGRGHWGDYLTILLGMVPAVIYTTGTFIWKREWNITGIFFLSIISLNFLMNLLSHSAEQELWNSVWMGYLSIAFYSLTIFIKRPIGMYFFIDYAHAKGIPRENSKALYSAPAHFHYFVKFTLFLCLRELVVIVIKTVMIKRMGIEGFNAIQITSSVLNYIFTALMIIYIMYIIKQTKKTAAVDSTESGQ
jgi:hypothetical protein